MSRFWKWLKQLWALQPSQPPTQEFVIPTGTSDDDIQATILQQCLAGEGRFVLGTRQSDGSVLVQSSPVDDCDETIEDDSHYPG